MAKDRISLEVSSKHVVLRTILFAAAFILAVFSFTKAITSIGHKDPGWQHVSASADSETPFYASGIDLYIYLDGSSGEIRRTLSKFSSEYSNNLKRLYRILDSKNIYEDYVNLATVNQSLGQKVIIPKELFIVLSDAYEKTLSGEANLFAGPVYTAEKAVENSLEYDSSYEAGRISRIQEACDNLNNFTLILNPAECSVVFNVSDSFKTLMEELECPADYLNLNYMYYDYVTSLLGSIFRDAGYGNFVFQVGDTVYEP